MAGVGFELKKLFSARTAAGHLKAYAYSAIVTVGPFILMTGMVLAIQFLFSKFGVGTEASSIFVASVIYGFVFSQILSCGFTMVMTRYLADCLTVEKHEDVTASMFGISAVMLFLGSILAALFYWGSPLQFSLKLAAFIFFLLLIMIWTESVYLTAIKRFRRLIFGYAFGTILTIGLAYLALLLEITDPVVGALYAMDMGMAIVVIIFLLHITAFFGRPREALNFSFLPYFEKHWRLFFISFCYTLGIFLPNIIAWQSPLGVVVGDTYRYSPVYDVLTFYAFLSILPLMTMFVVSVETTFYERYARYFSHITNKGNFREIDDAKKDLIQVLWFELRHVIEFQFVFTLVFLALGNYILSFSGVNSSEVNMYNVILFAAFFTGVLQIIYIIIIYFDAQKDVLVISTIFLGLNAVLGIFGWLCVGVTSFGFTFFISAGITLLFAVKRLAHFMERINYFVFCSQPMFYHPPDGILSYLARKLYGDKLIQLEKGGDV